MYMRSRNHKPSLQSTLRLGTVVLLPLDIVWENEWTSLADNVDFIEGLLFII